MLTPHSSNYNIPGKVAPPSNNEGLQKPAAALENSSDVAAGEETGCTTAAATVVAIVETATAAAVSSVTVISGLTTVVSSGDAPVAAPVETFSSLDKLLISTSLSASRT